MALVELESSVSDSEEEEEEESDSEEDSSEITEQNLKLPGHTDKKNPIIQVLQGEEGV